MFLKEQNVTAREIVYAGLRKRRRLSYGNAMSQYTQVLFRIVVVIELRETMQFRLLLAEHRVLEPVAS